MTLNESGNITSNNIYEPFGKQIPLMQGESTRLSFISKESDIESSLGDFVASKYDEEIGRFTSIDPLWEKYLGWSPYHYCRNNPVMRVDPTSLDDFIYNGKYLFYRNDDLQVLWAVQANSGREEHMNNPESQDVKNEGPIREGSYSIDFEESDIDNGDRSGGGWGLYGWRLQESLTTKVSNRIAGRGGFFLHEDAGEPGSLGCISVISDDNSKSIKLIKNTLLNYQDKGNTFINVLVDYDYKAPPIKAPDDKETKAKFDDHKNQY